QQNPAGLLISRIKDSINRWLSETNPKPPDNLLEDSVRPGSIDYYLSLLKVEPKAGTRLVSVSFTSTESTLASRIVNAHVREFVSLGLEMQGDEQRTARDFLKSKLVAFE